MPSGQLKDKDDNLRTKVGGFLTSTLIGACRALDVNIKGLDDDLVLNTESCPTVDGKKWRSEIETTEIWFGTSGYTTLKTITGPGALDSFILDFNSDRVDVRLEIDGCILWTIDLDDLENFNTFDGGGSSSSSGGGGAYGSSSIPNMWVKTGSKFFFNPKCKLKFDTEVKISAKSETGTKKLTSAIYHYLDCTT